MTRLYRLLKTMKNDGLVDVSKTKGPYGPERRIYRVGPRGERYLRGVLKDAMGIVLHFYDAFRLHSFKERLGELEEIRFERPEGEILVSMVSPLMMGNKGMKMMLHQFGEKRPIHVIGDTTVWEQLRTPFTRVEGTLSDIKCRNSQFTEVWLLGTPHRSELPSAVVEMKRVLKEKGVLRLVAPFAFFDEPESPTLEAFMRLTATHLFPDLGVVEGSEISALFEQLFEDWGIVRFQPGLVEFWGVNVPSTKRDV